VRRVLLAKDQDWYRDDEKPCEVPEEGNGFEHWQDLCTPGIEEYSDDQKGKHDQRVLPIWEAEAGIGHLDHSLNLRCDDKGARSHTCEPAQSRHPTYCM